MRYEPQLARGSCIGHGSRDHRGSSERELELTENYFHAIKVIVITAAIIYTNPTIIAIMPAGNSFSLLC